MNLIYIILEISNIAEGAKMYRQYRLFENVITFC
jgi:hypothetical protein